jgi:hypothetical protein
MNSTITPQESTVSCEPDSAAIFACAQSLWDACQAEAARNSSINLSEDYNGYDQFMREIMRIATLFENWACEHVEFTAWGEVWPYYLGDNFGAACLDAVFASHLARFDENDCLRVALRLRLPVKVTVGVPVPVNIEAANPVAGSAFVSFKIQTIRSIAGDSDFVALTADDEPFDEEYGAPYFGLYGVGAEGLSEHIADRTTYAEALTLARKLAPGIKFPSSPTLLDSFPHA